MQLISHISQTKNLTIGGKAKNLFRLQEIGLNVPQWIVIPQETLQEVVPEEIQGGSREGILSHLNSFMIPQRFIDDIAAQFPNTIYFAVRSSAIDEDGNDFSFAGQFESYLYVTKDDLAEHIKKVWCSAFSERVFQYRQNNKLQQHFGIAVIVQEMVAAESAGVAFGIDPVTGDRSAKVISAVYGLGEGLVSGELDSDNFILSSTGIQSQLAEKKFRFVMDSELKKGTKKIEVETRKQKLPALTEKQVMEIGRILDVCAKEYGKPQDMEFAAVNGTIYLLQARPITNLQKTADTKGEYIVWDNSNIIESYPGVTTPLTFSFIIKMYEAVYRQFAEMMRVSQKDIDANADVFSNMLGLLEGRVYYNLLSWYKALALLPGYSLNAGFMEKMMGVKERFELKDQKKRTKFRERIRVFNMIRIMLKNNRALPAMRATFQADFNGTMERYEAIELSRCRPEELMKLYTEFEQTLLKKWKAPLVNDFFAMIYFGVMQKLILEYKIAENVNIGNDLLCGAKDIISTEPVHRSLAIATLVANEPEAKKLFLENKEHIILKELEKGNFPQIKRLIDEYIAKFGERCVGELKLETITYKQNPAAFIRIIRSYVEQGVTSENASNNIEAGLRKNAEEKVRIALRGRFFKKKLFNYFLKRARVLVSQRENLRYERTRGFGMVRQIFCAIGQRFYAEGIIEHPRDIFYLTKEEIFDHIKGTSVNGDIKKLAAFRKEEFASFEKKNLSERIVTYGTVYHANNFFQQKKTSILKGDLKGIGCCPGRVKAKVRVVKDPNEVENLDGDILVTSSTDPGWVTLFPTASAILVERGSLLSHSAIVSREMGKPCIVGITGLLDILKTGDEVEMDGSTGEITIIKH
ncbi:MAG TPA: PEP/pyruvate-binding domain-containing protein [Bacteroidia bacterium]|jgi:pyruvate,water dikinase